VGERMILIEERMDLSFMKKTGRAIESSTNIKRWISCYERKTEAIESLHVSCFF
jgi:hypothetical protein